jgi:arylformamidase
LSQASAATLGGTLATIDYEAEYNNRARVPEHPQIFARWARDAKAYREETTRLGRAELGIRFGASPRQTIDLFLPAEGAAAPLALFIHGGWWRSLEPASFSHMARGLNAHGVAVAVAGYDLCPQVTIADIITQMQQACLHLWHRFRRHIMVYGHSAGGHLTACLLATDWPALAPGAPADLVPIGYAISGVFDLAPLVGTSINTDLRLDAEEARRLSPLFFPIGDPMLHAVVGALESSEFLRQSQMIVEAWRQDDAETRYEAIAGANHFTVLDPLTDPASPMVARLLALTQRAHAGEF